MLQSNSLLAQQDFCRSYNWDVTLPSLSTYNGTYQGEDVALYIQEISFGNYTINDLTPIRHGPFQTHSAGMFEIGTITMEFLCPTNCIVMSYFDNWKGQIVDQSDPNNPFYYPKSNYVYNSIVNFYDNGGNNLASYTLLNIFPKTFPSYKLSYESETMIKFPIEFSVDQIYLNTNT